MEVLPEASVLLVFHSVCTGSADGYCQAIDAFLNAQTRPVWHKSYFNILRLRATPRGFTVKASSYAPNDPLCCPSQPPVTDTYTWTGGGMHESGPAVRGLDG